MERNRNIHLAVSTMLKKRQPRKQNASEAVLLYDALTDHFFPSTMA